MYARHFVWEVVAKNGANVSRFTAQNAPSSVVFAQHPVFNRVNNKVEL